VVCVPFEFSWRRPYNILHLMVCPVPHSVLNRPTESFTFNKNSTVTLILISRRFEILHRITETRDSSVDIALGYGLDDQGSRVRFRRELGILLFTTASRTALGSTKPLIQ
jgi:hypothetical protein